MKATAFAPGSIGNVGPGFDVLGLAVGGIGDRVTIELTRGASSVEVTGRDASLIPSDPEKNSAAIAANHYLRPFGFQALMKVDKGLALAGGMGGSAASAVAGAFAAGLALGQAPRMSDVIAAALEGEAAVAGRHLDNIASSALGGLTLSRSVDPIDVLRLSVQATWFIALVTPDARVRTEEARALLPSTVDRGLMIQQMANTTALAHAFATGDVALVGRALDDGFAEPRRASLIPHFEGVKRAALDCGALGCSISGSGPTVFALAPDEATARRCAAAMRAAFREVSSTAHVGPIDREGVREVSR
jgi:homoserine kinase